MYRLSTTRQFEKDYKLCKKKKIQAGSASQYNIAT